MTYPLPITARVALTLLLSGSLLTACNKGAPNQAANGAPAVAPPIAALPLATATPPPLTPAPAASALPPPSRPLRLAYASSARRYRYIDEADAMGRAFADTPPDYTVDYGGTRPWIWRADNGAYRVVEQLPEGERDYYYEPGADQPFLVRDPDYSYAYDDGSLAAVYGPDGYPVDAAIAAQRADDASRYYERARALRHAAQYEQRQAVYAENWQARHEALAEQQQRWDTAQAQDADWQAWHQANQQDEERQWAHERDQRLAYAAAIGVGVGALGAVLIHRHDEARDNNVPPPAGKAPSAGYPPEQGAQRQVTEREQQPRVPVELARNQAVQRAQAAASAAQAERSAQAKQQVEVSAQHHALAERQAQTAENQRHATEVAQQQRLAAIRAQAANANANHARQEEAAVAQHRQQQAPAAAHVGRQAAEAAQHEQPTAQEHIAARTQASGEARAEQQVARVQHREAQVAQVAEHQQHQEIAQAHAAAHQQASHEHQTPQHGDHGHGDQHNGG